MARDRQRAKQRQAQRRAERLADGESRAPGAPAEGSTSPEPAATGAARGGAGDDASNAASGAARAPRRERDREGTAPPGEGVETGADLTANAPPEATGRSDTVVDTPPPPLVASPDSDPDAAASSASVGVADDEREDLQGRNKVIAFLIASWAELKRVQWPNRQQTTTLTAVVLGFVVIMGAYLGALDAVFSRLIQLII
jgi:preprotein translocase SecE subunit